MTPCAKPGCGGTIGDDGYCSTCGFKAAAATSGGGPSTSGSSATAGLVSSSVTPSSPTVRTGSTTSRTSRGSLGAGLVSVPPVPVRDPATLVQADPKVPERRRFCGKCEGPVGRGRDGVEGHTHGFCVHCVHPYSFEPKLAPGDLVAGQYETVGCLAHGGLGWIYLARDLNVSGKYVVLKGLLDSGDESAMAAAIAEQRSLAEVDHPDIVRIINFVEHEGAGYIVMDYVGGRSLRDLRQHGPDGKPSPLPVDEAIAYMLAILPAFGYLHDRGRLYCDFKPDNAIQSEEQVRLIDLGAVRRIDDDDSAIYGTIGYQAPEVAEVGPSVASDLYTVGRTLAVLSFDFPGYQDPARYATSLPPVEDVAVLGRYPSFAWFLAKATDPDPANRFQSAGEMADQLLGVLREVVAIDGRPPASAPSVLFTPELLADAERPDWRNLPLPKVDANDPGAALLASLSTAQPDQLLAALLSAPDSPEITLRIVRAHLETGDLDQAATGLLTADPADWRTTWWQGVLRLAEGRETDAIPRFEPLAHALPGELAPKLALASACEAAADRARAAGPAAALSGRPPAEQDDAAGRLYQLVAMVDPLIASATFGLARTRRRAGDRHGAAEALTRIPATAISSTTAQVERCRVLSEQLDGAAPTVDDLVEASAGLDRLTAEPGVRAGLRRDLLRAGLDLLESSPSAADPAVRLAGAALAEPDLRRVLEQTYRTMAKQAPTEAERVALIDQANRSRPRTLV